MKKNRRAHHAFHYLKKQFPRLKKQASQTRDSKLWHLEAALRGKIKDLGGLSLDGIGGYSQLYEDYVGLLKEVSIRLLSHYNDVHRTNYSFDEITNNSRAYLSSGVISVLVTNHIPRLVAEEFRRRLPSTPKDEYPRARRLKRKFFLHLGETNTGKTHEALQRLKQSESGLYLAPLRILALENFERLNREGLPCSLLTGEEEIIVPQASHASCTVEKANITGRYDLVVIDEIQMVADLQRGDAWTRAILGICSPEIHLCGAFNAREQLIHMIEECGDEYEIKEYRRTIPLKIERKTFKLNEILTGDAIVAFSKRRVLTLSRHFADLGVKNSVIYGDLPPEVRRLQYDAFISGESRILISTDAIGMGVNLPIRRIIFTESRKFDGQDFRLLTSQEVKQIAGRAGRIGLYEVGYVASMDGEIDFLSHQLEADDSAIESAIVGPSDVLLQIGLLPLKEKIALWSSWGDTSLRYRKKDVRDYLMILESLEHYKLPETDQWRLMVLPFDVHNEELLAQFLVYVDEHFVQKQASVSLPELRGKALAMHEEFYQKINLYYSFSKALGLQFDEAWVMNTRARVCEDINRILQA
ncbi:MAG: helicase-related protein [Christensenellales bacterium]|jgi:ATP-dependent RNA helicase SUPV3L1/SUV3